MACVELAQGPSTGDSKESSWLVRLVFACYFEVLLTHAAILMKPMITFKYLEVSLSFPAAKMHILVN